MKDFKEFLELAGSEDLKRKREIMAELKLQDYLDEDGNLPQEDVLNAAYSSTMEAVMQLLLQYHKWSNEQ